MKKQRISLSGYSEDALTYIIVELAEQGFDIHSSDGMLTAEREFEEGDYPVDEEPPTVH